MSGSLPFRETDGSKILWSGQIDMTIDMRDPFFKDLTTLLSGFWSPNPWTGKEFRLNLQDCVASVRSIEVEGPQIARVVLEIHSPPSIKPEKD